MDTKILEIINNIKEMNSFLFKEKYNYLADYERLKNKTLNELLEIEKSIIGFYNFAKDGMSVSRYNFQDFCINLKVGDVIIINGMDYRIMKQGFFANTNTYIIPEAENDLDGCTYYISYEFKEVIKYAKWSTKKLN